MPTFLIEAYAPRSSAREARAAARGIRAAATQVSEEGTFVRHVRTTFVPVDETCFHVVEAASEDVVREVCRRAGIGSARVVAAVE